MEGCKRGGLTDIKVDLADGCDAVLNLLGKQLDNGNCNSIIRVDIGYFHHSQEGGAAALRRGPSVRLSEDEMLLVFQGVVCCLPNMKTLVVMSYFRADAMSLPVAALEMLFRRANKLEILFLHQIKLHGSAHQFRIMARSLNRHPALKRVNLHCCEGNDPPHDSHHPHQHQNRQYRPPMPTLDPLVIALAELPTMYYLSLDQVPISQASIEALSKSQSLKDISFYNMPHLKSCLRILFETLGRRSGHNNLRGVRIRSCNLGREEAVSIAKMLETNTSLESLVFYVDEWEDYGTSLALALSQNTNLKRLEVGISSVKLVVADTISMGNTNHLQAGKSLGQALEANTMSSLQNFCLCLPQAQSKELYDAYMGPLERMLESNFTLEQVLLQGKDAMSVVSPKVGFLLRLNQRSELDRSKLFRDVVEQENSARPWVESMGRHTDDLSILFYLLGKNPNLVASMQG